MLIPGDGERPDEPAVVTHAAFQRAKSGEEVTEVLRVLLPFCGRGAGRDELVDHEHGRRRAASERLCERACERREQLVPQSRQRRVFVDGGGEERTGETIQPLGCTSARTAPLGRGHESGEVVVEGLVGLGLDPDDDGSGSCAGEDEQVVVAHAPRNVIEPSLVLHDPALERDIAQGPVRCQQRVQLPCRVALGPGPRKLEGAPVFFPVAGSRGWCETSPIGSEAMGWPLSFSSRMTTWSRSHIRAWRVEALRR